MDKKLYIECTDLSDDILMVHFKGIIDEDSDFSSIPLKGKKEYHFNFNDINAINSCGIREWVSFTEKLNKEAKLIFLNCTQMIVEQINMVAGFFPKGSEIRNFYAPYFCDNCDKEKSILLEKSQIEGTEAPSVKCPECGEEMEFDALEEQYFRFLK